MLTVTSQISIPESELHVTFIRASGPGGQNVNRVATAVQLRFDVAHSPSLPLDVKQRLIRLAGKRITAEGVLVIEARRFRTQERNRQDALDRVVALVRRAAAPPKLRRASHPSAASKTRRLEKKRRRGETKRARRWKQEPD